MRKRLIAGLILLTALLCLSAAALAADTPFKFSMTLGQTSFVEPGNVTVGIQVANASDEDLPGPVTLYYPNGKQVEEFGTPTLAAGGVSTWTGTWKVTQAQLESGKITFSVEYTVYNDDGQLINKKVYFSKPISYEGAVTSVEINRTITPNTAEKGQKVTVIYELVNTGNTNITDITIRENDSISTAQGKIDQVSAGEKKTYSFETTMGTKNLTSQATIKYKVGSKSYTAKKDAVTIKYGQVNLKATLTADKKGGQAGETVKLTLTLKNSGKSDYTDVTVTDRNLGQVFSGQTVAAGKTETLVKEIVVENTQDYLFEITAVDPSGVAVSTSTSPVSVTALTAEDIIYLNVEAQADRSTVYTLPGTVRFTVKVTNNGSSDLENVSVYATDVRLYNFPLVKAGETREFVRDVGVSMAGQYQFEARVTDKLNQTQRFLSNVLPIAYTAPTAAPTEAPIITPPVPSYEPLPTSDGLPEYVDIVQQGIDILFWVMGGIALLSGILLVIGLIRRAGKNARLAGDNNYTEMDLAPVTDYAGRIRKGTRRIVDDGSDEETGDEPEEAADTAADEPETAEEEGSGSDGTRRRR